MAGLVLLALCTFAFLVPIECVVLQLDNSNFDQVKAIVFYQHAHNLLNMAFVFVRMQYVNGDKHAFVEFYAPCKFV